MSEVKNWPPTKSTESWGQNKPDGKYLTERMVDFKDQRNKGNIPFRKALKADVEYHGTNKSPVDYRAGKNTHSNYIYQVFETHE